MLGRKLTDADWKRLVGDEVVPAFLAQLPNDFSLHADWTGRRLIREEWGYEETAWCVQAVTGWRRFDNLYGMLHAARDGRLDRDGNQIGGWRRSDEFRDLVDADTDMRKLEHCRIEKRDVPHWRGECGTFSRCETCPDRELWQGKTVKEVSDE